MTRKSVLFLAVLFLALVGAVFYWWGRAQIPVIPAAFSKARDFLDAAESVGGFPWWSPMFMQGTSLAHSWAFMLTNALLWLFSFPLGFPAGPQAAIVAMMLVGAVGVFFFVRRYVEEDGAAFLGALLYLLCPSLLVRAGGDSEHFATVCSMALLPWSFLGALNFFQNPSLRSGVLAAMAFAAVTLAHEKAGVLALPVVLLFSAVEYWGRPAGSRPEGRWFLWAVGVFFFLAVVPNLPGLREKGFVAMFGMGPFRDWQTTFATKSALGWIDRSGLLTEGISPIYAPTTANGGTYLGLGVFALFVAALFSGVLHDTPAGRKARCFLVLALLAFWLSFGPKGVLGGHLFFLSLSLGAPDFVPALGWFFLAAQVWMIFRLVPPEWPFRKGIAVLISLVYLVVPGFRLLELLPVYKNIRAPFDFFQVSGTVCVVISAAILARLLLERLKPGVVRSGLVAVVCSLMILDVAPYAKSFFQRNLAAKVFGDFLAAEEFIRDSQLPGRVYAFSGRYFYLMTPWLSGRPLVAEAFHGHLQQRGAAILQGAAFANDECLASYLNIAGVSHVLLDKNDPDTPRDLQIRLRALFPVGFENDHFAVLENRSSLGAGFLARDFIQSPLATEEATPAIFGGARYNMAVVEMPGGGEEGEPGLRGRVVEGRIQALKPGESMLEGRPFQPAALSGKGTYQQATFAPTGEPGWLVMNQAWHPDWKAYQMGTAVKVHRAFLAFSAVRTDGKNPVEFRFEAPGWYGLCAGLGVLSWTLAFLLVLFSKWLPATFRQTRTHD